MREEEETKRKGGVLEFSGLRISFSITYDKSGL